MRSLAVGCEVSTHSRAAIEHLAKSDWTSAEFVGLSVGAVARAVRSNGIRISSADCEFEIGAVSVDIAPKWEAFVLHAVAQTAGAEHNAAKLDSRRPASTDERFEAFLGRNHTLFVITREYAVPPSHAGMFTRVSVEDALLIRDRSGQQALIAVDEENPGGVVMSRVREDIDRVLSDASLIRPVCV